MCVGPEAVVRRDAVADGDHRSPLAKAGAHLRVLGEPVAQTVQALGDLLARRTGERLAPVATLMPGITPRGASSTGNGTPSELDWRSVSSNRIAPLMCSSIPSVVNTSSRNRQRASSVDSTSTCSRRFDMSRCAVDPPGPAAAAHVALAPCCLRLRGRAAHTRFVGRILRRTAVGGTDAIVPAIAGRAWITGVHQFVLDPDDRSPRASRSPA